jgi:hypothetical protein
MTICQVVKNGKTDYHVICLTKISEIRIAVSNIVYNLHISLSELSMWNVSDCCKDETEVK